jgi:hypothetical protein
MKKHYTFYFFAVLSLILTACFQPVDIGETFVEKATAHLRVSNDSQDNAYVLEGLELRNAEGEIEQSWVGLDLTAGDEPWEVHTETSGSCTLWYRVKDTEISSTAIGVYQAKPPVEIALNRSHEFSFRGEEIEVTQEDADGDGLPDAWETEHGFNPEDKTDGGTVYVSPLGQDEAPGNGTRDQPYLTLAKAAAKAGRGLIPEARTVVVLDTLNWRSGNRANNPEYKGRDDSVFYLGKTRNPITVRGEGGGVLSAVGSGGKRVLYLDIGANIALQDISIMGGRGKGGGIFASGATLTLKSGAMIENNNASPGDDLTGIVGGGIYMENGGLVMEAGSSVKGNKADNTAGLRLFASELTMNGGTITNNHANLSSGGMAAENSTVKMFNGAEISGNSAGAEDMVFRATAGGVLIGSSELTMYAGSKIGGNKVYGWAGGIYVAGESTLIMEDGEISSNECIKLDSNPSNNGWGGGVVLSDRGSFIMKGGVIAGNTAGKYGGGIFLVTVASSFIMSGGKVYGYSADDTNSNTAKTTEYYKGHAIYDYRAVMTERTYDTTVTTFP